MTVNERPTVGQAVYVVESRRTYPRGYAQPSVLVEETREATVTKVGRRWVTVQWVINPERGYTATARFDWATSSSDDPFGNDRRRMFTHEGRARYERLVTAKATLEQLLVTVRPPGGEDFDVETYEAIVAAILADPAIQRKAKA